MTPGLLHLEPEVIALTGALTDAHECRQAAVLLGEVVDQLLDDDRLADTGAAEQADLAALRIRREQVDDLDPGLEHLGRRSERLEGRGVAMDRPTLGVVRERFTKVDRLAEDVEDPAQRRAADRHGNRPPVSTISVPRERPSVVSIATARTRSSPRCC